MSDGIEVKTTGIPEMRQALLAIPDKLRARAVLNALAAGARVVRDVARHRTPVLKLSTQSGNAAFKSGRRKPGTVRDAISVRTSKQAKLNGDVGVFVNVRPAKGAKFKTVTAPFSGWKTRHQTRVSKRNTAEDPYYWRWLNFGWTPATVQGKTNKYYKRERRDEIGGANFLEHGARALPAALRVFVAKIIPAINKLDKPKAPAP